MTIKLPALALTLGGLLLAVGLFIGFAPMKASGYDCGSAWRAGNDYAIVLTGGGLRDVAACEDARSSRSTTAWALMIPGVLLLVVGGAAAATGGRLDEKATAPRPA